MTNRLLPKSFIPNVKVKGHVMNQTIYKYIVGMLINCSVQMIDLYRSLCCLWESVKVLIYILSRLFQGVVLHTLLCYSSGCGPHMLGC